MTTHSRLGNLDKKTDEELLSTYHNVTDGVKDKIGDYIIEKNMKLVRYLARKFNERVYLDPAIDLEDLEQQGAIGLILARNRYDPERGIKFITYATETILGEMRRYLRDKGRVKSGASRKIHSYERAKEELEQKFGRPPKEEEILERLGITLEELGVIETALNMQRAVSLDTVIDEDGNDLADLSGNNSEGYARIELKDCLRKAMGALDEKDKRAGMVLRLHMGGLSQTKIGERIGYRQMTVSGLLHRAREELKQELRKSL